jgi:acetoin utilization deacetylase AcuC-like enzyme
MIGGLDLPTLVVQEGGYRTQTLGANARHFFTGLWEGMSDSNAKGQNHKSKVR